MLLTDPDMPKAVRRPRGLKSTAGYLMAVRAAIRLQRNWRRGAERRELLEPSAVYPRDEAKARAIKSTHRGAVARREAEERRRAAAIAGLETWGTLHPLREPTEAELRAAMAAGGLYEGLSEEEARQRLISYDELKETLPEAQAERAQRQRQHEKQLRLRALQRQRDGVRAWSAGSRRRAPRRALRRRPQPRSRAEEVGAACGTCRRPGEATATRTTTTTMPTTATGGGRAVIPATATTATATMANTPMARWMVGALARLQPAPALRVDVVCASRLTP